METNQAQRRGLFSMVIYRILAIQVLQRQKLMKRYGNLILVAKLDRPQLRAVSFMLVRMITGFTLLIPLAAP